MPYEEPEPQVRIDPREMARMLDRPHSLRVPGNVEGPRIAIVQVYTGKRRTVVDVEVGVAGHRRQFSGEAVRHDHDPYSVEVGLGLALARALGSAGLWLSKRSHGIVSHADKVREDRKALKAKRRGLNELVEAARHLTAVSIAEGAPRAMPDGNHARCRHCAEPIYRVDGHPVDLWFHQGSRMADCQSVRAEPAPAVGVAVTPRERHDAQVRDFLMVLAERGSVAQANIARRLIDTWPA